MDRILIRKGDFTPEADISLARSHRAGAAHRLFCANDQMAFGAIRAAKELGLTVPEDLSVVGFDNIPFSLITILL